MSSRPRALGAVILAAGASSRMGQPKALIQWRGASFYEHAIARAMDVGCAPIVLVSGAVELDGPEGVLACRNERWRDGQLSSLQAGVGRVLACAPPVAGCLVLTVDRPAVLPATVGALVSAWRGEPEGLWQPRHRGRTGHPMLFPADLLAPLLALEASSSARELVRSRAVAARRRFVDVDDPGVIQNVDTPDDLTALGL